MESKRKVVGRPPKLTTEQIAELRSWAAAKKALLTTKQMAEKLGIHKHTIANYLEPLMHEVDGD
jgi:DNA-binding CsgD family transcriptional regulator